MVKDNHMKQEIKKIVTIGDERVGDSYPAFIVAEAGVNHNGDMTLAKELIVQAKEAGANAIKFQAFSAALLCDLELTETKDVEGITGGTNSSYEMYKKLELHNDQIAELAAYAHTKGIVFFVSVFDEQRVDFLDTINIPCYKISSGDLTHTPLLRYTAQKKRPIIISTGMATLDEVHKAVQTIEQEGVHDIVILHCTADYPPRDEEMNLSVLKTLKDMFPHPIGFSDHSTGVEIAYAARAFGATMIEKHFTLDHNLEGPDHTMSLDPQELKQLVSGIRRIERTWGRGVKEPTHAEQNLIFSGRRGIKAARTIHCGDIIALADVKIVKPASGIPPEYVMNIIGKKATRDVKQNDPIEWEAIED